MSQVQALAALSGLLLGGALLGGTIWWQSTLEPPPQADWRPPCVARLGKAWAAVQPTAAPDPRPARNLLFGVDRSGSNGELSDTQLDAAVAYAANLEPQHGVGILLITDQSDRSTTPDMPFEPGSPGQVFRPGPLPCGPDCAPDSMFAQKCGEQLEAAQDRRVASLTADEADRRTRQQEDRAVRVHAWRERAAAYKPKPGTSLLGFFAKLADLPPVRREPERTTVVVLSDLETTQHAERKQIEAFDRKYRSSGTCPDVDWLPRGISGLEIVLLQTVRDKGAEAWASRWDAVLGCAGAHVRRHRYSSAVPLDQLLDTPTAPALALAGP
jgi:hypothetical protein